MRGTCRDSQKGGVEEEIFSALCDGVVREIVEENGPPRTTCTSPGLRTINLARARGREKIVDRIMIVFFT